MTSLFKPSIDITKTICKIDSFLLLLKIRPVLNYRNIEYQLKKEGKFFMNIRLMKNSIVFMPLLDIENNTENKFLYNQIRDFLKKL